MVALSLQTLLLMGAAYFVGAALACMLRRSLSTATQASAERRVDPLPEVAARAAQDARFGRAMEPRRAPAPRAVAQPAAASAAQDLGNIHNIDAGTETGLNKLGITRYEQIAGWMRADVDRVSEALRQKGRINQENWIEQAQVLAKGGETVYSARRAAGPGSTAQPTPDEGERGPPTPSAPLPRPMSRVGVSAAVIAPPPDTRRAAAPTVAGRAAGADAGPGQAVPIRPGAPPSHDNLQRIGGITAAIEQKLNALGVSRYSQIAQWSAAVAERFDGELGAGGRIARENWVEQAQILGRGGDTRFSRQFDRPGHSEAPPPRPIRLPDAIREHEAAVASEQAETPKRTDLGSLRSVRSEAYQDTPEPGPEAAQRAASRSKMARATAGADDLKRIRGIGVLTEKRLNQMGISTYGDIANWTRQDIDRVSRSLDFKGRIERENWVEQARILMAGGDTEFSRRIDRKGSDKGSDPAGLTPGSRQ